MQEGYVFPEFLHHLHMWKKICQSPLIKNIQGHVDIVRDAISEILTPLQPNMLDNKDSSLQSLKRHVNFMLNARVFFV